MKFLISGLPRSRTAWLANFLSNGDSLCSHSCLLDYDLDMARLLAHFDTVSHLYQDVGDACPSLLYYFKDIWNSRPDIRWVIVMRKTPDSKAGYDRAFPELPLSPEAWERTQAAYRFACETVSNTTDRYRAILTSFADLIYDSECNRIHKFCLGREMDFLRWEILNRMNVQADKRAWQASLSPSMASRLKLLEHQP